MENNGINAMDSAVTENAWDGKFLVKFDVNSPHFLKYNIPEFTNIPHSCPWLWALIYKFNHVIS